MKFDGRADALAWLGPCVRRDDDMRKLRALVGCHHLAVHRLSDHDVVEQAASLAIARAFCVVAGQAPARHPLPNLNVPAPSLAAGQAAPIAADTLLDRQPPPPRTAARSVPPVTGGPVPTPVLHWIEIELLGEDDRPIANEPYCISTPSGATIRGMLDQAGRARIADIPVSGACRVMFPSLDQDAWQTLVPTSSAPSAATRPSTDRRW